MRRNPADIMITAVVGVAACAAAVAGAPVPVLAVLGIPLFAAPGYVLGEVLLSERVAGLERVVVAAVLALAVPVLGGLALYAAGVPLHRVAWACLLTGVTLAGDGALVVRRAAALRRAAPGAGGLRSIGLQSSVPATAQQAAKRGWGNRVAPGPHSRRGTGRPSRALPLPAWHLAAFGAAVVIAAGGVGIARVGAAVQHYPGFTQLWLSPGRAGAASADLGVSNHEGKAARYQLVLVENGRTAASWDIRLANGGTWDRSITLSGPVTADLYRLPGLTHPYRFVTARRTGS